MALVTFCPGCNTTFRVNSAQLQAQDGNVRCGHCQRVFNGFATLITVNESAIEYPPPIVARPIQVHSPTRNDYSDWSPAPADTPDRLFDDIIPAKKTHALWGWINFILLLLLAGQLAHHHRTELTSAIPETRPYFERYCTWLNCTVPYARQIELLGIESSDLQKNTTHPAAITTMHATIRNHASFPQAPPALHLLLLDTREQVVASRIFTPQDYWPGDDKKTAFIKPKQDIEIRLDFDSSRLNALGYRLSLLYP